MKKPKHWNLLSLLVLSPLLLGLSAGDPAPTWSAKNQDGRLIQSHEFKGKAVLLYFGSSGI
jgi:hypothetical protein